MKKITYSILTVLLLGFGACSLEPEYFGGVESGDAITSPVSAQTALNGTYYVFGSYRFGGRNVIAIGDVPTDLMYNMNRTSHFLNIYQYLFSDTNDYLRDIWQYGYKTIDHATRIIVGVEAIYSTALAEEQEEYDQILGEAYGLRALASLYLVNVFALPYKVADGTDNGSKPGIVTITSPKKPGDKVSRATVADTYTQIFTDIDKALEHFGNLGGSWSNGFYINEAAIYALQARAALYAEDFDLAIEAAGEALALSGGYIETDPDAYEGMFADLALNSETIFTVSKSIIDNPSANSIGTLYSNYGISPELDVIDTFFDPDGDDIRYPMLSEDAGTRYYLGGKYVGTDGNAAVANIPIFRVAEQYLIIAEAEVRSGGSLANAKDALFEVAQRNPDLTYASLPNSADALFEFIKEERARELILEGLRFNDLRRWGGEYSFRNFTDFDMSKFCYPIPAAEINTNSGVTQNDGWSAALPN